MRYLTYITMAGFAYLTYMATGYMTVADASDVKTPIVLELFTSQSCSSCPPADKALGELAKNPNVIALSCHVTYWNHLSWKDTLSKTFCTDRQRHYSVTHHRGGRIFTPELIVNGTDSMVGSNGRDISKALTEHTGRIQPIGIHAISNKAIALTLPALKEPGKAISLNLVTFGQHHTQSIPKGENHGRTIAYTNPVRHIRTIKTAWDGTRGTLDVALQAKEMTGNAGYAVLAHSDNAVGSIVAAGQLRLPTHQ